MKIFLLEDDPVLGDILEEHLQKQGYAVTRESDGTAAEAVLLKDRFDLLLLDVSVPGISGFELLEGLRRTGNTTPAIFITARSGSKDLKAGFDLGADDYIRKPFDYEELDARMAHVIKSRHLDQSHITLAEGVVFMPGLNRLQVGKQSVPLRKKEGELLGYLIKNAGRVVGTEELLSNLYAYDEPRDAATLRTYIKNLRRLMGKELIRNVRGLGYALEPL
ncbi:MAG: response regulator transcription factor [Campylobacterales bacterium]